MKIIVEATPKEIAALVLELQERQGSQEIQLLDQNNLGIQLCSEDIIKNQ